MRVASRSSCCSSHWKADSALISQISAQLDDQLSISLAFQALSAANGAMLVSASFFFVGRGFRSTSKLGEFLLDYLHVGWSAVN